MLTSSGKTWYVIITSNFIISCVQSTVGLNQILLYCYQLHGIIIIIIYFFALYYDSVHHEIFESIYTMHLVKYQLKYMRNCDCLSRVIERTICRQINLVKDFTFVLYVFSKWKLSIDCCQVPKRGRCCLPAIGRSRRRCTINK